mmetsp:Transcript_102525/g.296510  ORF Transcript_102525/g.296510 Transcript_102525/m.296510 type:complete len:277 (+) Transcript_102525:195-1025(+)
MRPTRPPPPAQRGTQPLSAKAPLPAHPLPTRKAAASPWSRSGPRPRRSRRRATAKKAALATTAAATPPLPSATKQLQQRRRPPALWRSVAASRRRQERRPRSPCREAGPRAPQAPATSCRRFRCRRLGSSAPPATPRHTQPPQPSAARAPATCSRGETGRPRRHLRAAPIPGTNTAAGAPATSEATAGAPTLRPNTAQALRAAPAPAPTPRRGSPRRCPIRRRRNSPRSTSEGSWWRSPCPRRCRRARRSRRLTNVPPPPLPPAAAGSARAGANRG